MTLNNLQPVGILRNLYKMCENLIHATTSCEKCRRYLLVSKRYRPKWEKTQGR